MVVFVVIEEADSGPSLLCRARAAMRAVALRSLFLSSRPSPTSSRWRRRSPSSSSSSSSSSVLLVLLASSPFFFVPLPPPDDDVVDVVVPSRPKRRATSPAALALRRARAASTDADLAAALIPDSAASRLRSGRPRRRRPTAVGSLPSIGVACYVVASLGVARWGLSC